MPGALGVAGIWGIAFIFPRALLFWDLWCGPCRLAAWLWRGLSIWIVGVACVSCTGVVYVHMCHLDNLCFVVFDYYEVEWFILWLVSCTEVVWCTYVMSVQIRLNGSRAGGGGGGCVPGGASGGLGARRSPFSICRRIAVRISVCRRVRGRRFYPL